MCDECTNNALAEEMDQNSDLYCEVCDRDESESVILTCWQDLNVCTDCLTHHEAMVAEECTDTQPTPPSKVFYATLRDQAGTLAKIDGAILFMAEDRTITVIEPEDCLWLVTLGEVGLANAQQCLDHIRGGYAKIACTRQMVEA